MRRRLQPITTGCVLVAALAVLTFATLAWGHRPGQGSSAARRAAAHAAASNAGPSVSLKFRQGERRTYQYEVRTASDEEAAMPGAIVYGMRCTVHLTVVQRASISDATAFDYEYVASRVGVRDAGAGDDGSGGAQEVASEAWVMALDVSACRAVRSSGFTDSANGREPRFVPYAPHDRLRTMYTKPFYIVQTTDGRVLSVYYPPGEHGAALHFKQGVASALHASLAPAAAALDAGAGRHRDSVLYNVLEADETGVYDAEYRCERTGAPGGDARRLRRLHAAGEAVDADQLQATHRVTRHADSDAFVELADRRGSTRQLEVTKTTTVELDASIGVVTSMRLQFSAVARDHPEPAHIRGDYTLSGANTPQNHVSGRLQLVSLVRVSDEEVAGRRLVSRADSDAGESEGPTAFWGDDGGSAVEAQVHVSAQGWGYGAPSRGSDVTEDAADVSGTATASDVDHDADSIATVTGQVSDEGTSDVVVLVKGGLLTRHHAQTYTAHGELKSDVAPVERDDDMRLPELLACLNHPALNDGSAAPRGFSFNARQVSSLLSHACYARHGVGGLPPSPCVGVFAVCRPPTTRAVAHAASARCAWSAKPSGGRCW